MIADGLSKRLLDIGRAALHSGAPRFSRFLVPPERLAAEQAAREVGVTCSCFGGYEEAERCVAGFSAQGAIEPEHWPIACLKVRWSAKFASAGHRDMLGALMALGLERATLGDIQMGDGCAYLFVLDEVASYLCTSLEGVGRTKVSVERVALADVQMAPPKGREHRITLSSMRLDALLAEGYNLSRSDAQSLIRRGLVKLNHIECLKGDRRVAQGDMLSVHGLGRLRLSEVQGETKKGRVGALVFRYGDT